MTHLDKIKLGVAVGTIAVGGLLTVVAGTIAVLHRQRKPKPPAQEQKSGLFELLPTLKPVDPVDIKPYEDAMIKTVPEIVETVKNRANVPLPTGRLSKAQVDELFKQIPIGSSVRFKREKDVCWEYGKLDSVWCCLDETCFDVITNDGRVGLIPAFGDQIVLA
jgi:hypothetical protein